MPAKLDIKVVPGASRTRVMGWLGPALKVAVAAPPESGKANAAVIELLAETLGVPSGSLAVAAGHARPRKTISFASVTQDQLQSILTAAGFPPPGAT